MATVETQKGTIAGRVGEEVFFVRNGRQMVRTYVPPTMIHNPRTQRQMAVRTRWANIVAAYKNLAGTLTGCFETRRAGQTDYNRFVGMNMQVPPVYLTRREAELGACIAAGYYISQGSLPEVIVGTDDGTAHTDIRLGSLELDCRTTVAALARAVVSLNADYEYGDRIAYYALLQSVATDGTPYVQRLYACLHLSPADQRPLAETLAPEGFSARCGFLARHPEAAPGAFAWMHTRGNGKRMLVSPQRLTVANPLLRLYTSDEAKERAIRSYLAPSATPRAGEEKK